ncbi:hypothetical protein ACFFVB_15685 [Formosa undariae]|uniref:Glycosyltransferase family 4 protein n=1 Tax=Formosa undariae TaxID=1325436 RepID=A0ABV5F510_9FLAO
MKKVLIISPHFPPVNAADMHRVRQSLPYFKDNGWEATVLYVSPEFVEMAKDPNLIKSIPTDVKCFGVEAFSTTYTRKLGLGNLGLRAFLQLYKKGNKLIKQEKFDLIYFSTTMFACMPLGRLWKKKFNIPFILDIQDPWRNDYYLTVPKEEQPPKFWFAYNLDKTLEKLTLPYADGLLAVSKGYIQTLKDRYPSIKNIPEKVLTFGAAEKDFDILPELNLPKNIKLDPEKLNFVYVGRGGSDMQISLNLLFTSFKEGLDTNSDFNRCKFWFIGTSYAPDGEGAKTIKPLADKIGVGDYVEEITDRKPYFEVLNLLKSSDAIIIPGSEDQNYTASKLYPNILAKKPLLCVFHSNSSVVSNVRILNAGKLVLFNETDAKEQCASALQELVNTLPYTPNTNWEAFKPFTAQAMTKQQTDFFNEVIN